MEGSQDQTVVTLLWPALVIVFIIAVSLVLLYQQFQKNLYTHKLRQEALKRTYQNDLLKVSIQVQEEERRRIAQDLHDELGAVLSIMRMKMVLLEQQSAGDNAVSDSLKSIRELSESAIASSRNISHRLLPPQLKSFGLQRTLEGLAAKTNEAGGVQIALDITADLSRLSWDVTLGLYRVMMELINNTIKHAGASAISIRIYSDKDNLYCDYSDNGKGLNETTAEGKGLGLKSMEGRIDALNGTMEIGKMPSEGFATLIKIPLDLDIV